MFLIKILITLFLSLTYLFADSEICYAIDDVNGKIYSLEMNSEADPIPVGTELELDKSNIFTGEAEAFRSEDGLIYGFQEQSNKNSPALYSANPNTGDVNLVTTFEEEDITIKENVVASSFYDGYLYIIAEDDATEKDYLYKIDPLLDWKILLEKEMPNIDEISGLAISKDGEAYVIRDVEDRDIYNLNLQTAVTTKINITLQEIDDRKIEAEGLSFAKDGNLYVEDADDEEENDGVIYKINLADGTLTPSARLPEDDNVDIEGLACNIVSKNTPIGCQNSAFIFQGSISEMNLLNLSTGEINTTNEIFKTELINGAGYNKKDGFIWGVDKNATNGGTVVRIGLDNQNNYMSQKFKIEDENFISYVGDIDNNGHLYIKVDNESEGSSVLVIDLDVNSSTYLTKIREFNMTQELDIHDWAFNPLDNQLYTIEKGEINNLYKIDPNSGEVTNLGDTQIGEAEAFGASFFDKDGNFYSYNNGNGNIYMVTPAISSKAVLFSSSQIVSHNDGAMCSDIEIIQPPRVTIADESTLEGDEGEHNLTFTVKLDKPAGAKGVKFRYQVFDGNDTDILENATAPSDYSRDDISIAVVLEGDIQEFKIHVPIKGDRVMEKSEKFKITLSDFVYAIGEDTEAVGTIINDDMIQLNIERQNSLIEYQEENNLTQEEKLNKKYNLYTQITRRDFNYSIVAYDTDNFEEGIEQKSSDLTVKIELIDGMDSNISTNILHSMVKTFNNQSRIDIDINNSNELNNIRATQYAYFKIYYPIDTNDSILLDNTCNGDINCIENLSFFKEWRATFARDSFSIRPAGFELMLWADDGTIRDHLATSNQEESYGIALASGYQYELEIKAIGYNNRTPEEQYEPRIKYLDTNQTELNPVQEVNATLIFDGNTTGCSDTQNKQLDYYQFSNGINQERYFSHDNVGNFIIKVTDRDWTYADQSTEPYKEGCILNSSTNQPDDTGKIGCNIDTTFSRESGDTFYDNYYDLKVYFQPYYFDVNLQLTSQPNSGHSDFLYMSNLTDNSKMALLIDGNITAKEKNGKTTTNFTESCLTHKVELSLDYLATIDKGDFDNKKPFKIRTTKKTSENPQGAVVLIQREEKHNNNEYSTVSENEILDNNVTLEIKDFKTSGKGSSFLALLYNIKKGQNETINPVKINFTKVNIKSEKSKSNLADNEIRDFFPRGEQNLSNPKIFYFTRVAPDKENYSITYGNSEKTPLSVEIFCDNNTTWCYDMIGENGEYTAKDGWYTSVNHNGLTDGTIENYEKPNDIDIDNNLQFINGRMNNLMTKLSKDANNETILFQSQDRVDTLIKVNATSWLKYHPDITRDGKSFWINHFVAIKKDTNGVTISTNGAELSGVGKAGYIINTKTNTDSSNKLNW